MKVKQEDNLESKILKRIELMSGNVILQKDVEDLSDKHQVSRALRKLVQKGKIAKIAYGVYAKVKKSRYTDKLLLAAPFSDVVKEALNKMQVEWDLTSAQKAYNEGKTTQVPVRPSVRLKSRMRRKFEFMGNHFYFEDKLYAH